MKQGAYKRGEARKSAKLTDAKVREIREAHAGSCHCCGHRPTLGELGARYGVSAVAIHKIVRRESWAHVQ